jgi:hypothetical protein
MGGMGSSSSRRGKKRPMPTLDEQGKTVERKVKRMIKNRESAARSRARKQVSVNPTVRRCIVLGVGKAGHSFGARWSSRDCKVVGKLLSVAVRGRNLRLEDMVEG